MSILRRLAAPLAIVIAMGSLAACVAYDAGPGYSRGGYYAPGVYVHEGYYHRRW